MTQKEYNARFVLAKVADLVLRNPQLWHPGPRASLREAVKDRFRDKASAGKEFVKLQIGANTMSHGASSFSSGSDSGDPVLAFLAAQQGGHRLVFVEANPTLEEPLHRNVARLFANATDTQVISAAVCESTSSSVSFWRLSAQFYEKHPDLQHLSQMSSLDRTWIHQVRQAFPHIDFEKHWEEVAVRCLSPAALLTEAKLQSEDVDAITVDVEGLETQLLGLFFSLDGFKPLVVEFDAFTMKYVEDNSTNYVAANLSPLLARLASLGYNVHHSADGIVALRA